ncbi:MAG: DUF294 nucleotidyltransferase-like domain-containing protein, partial [Actinomycetota bacterium]
MTAAADAVVDREAHLDEAARRDAGQDHDPDAGGERRGRDYCLRLAELTDEWVVSLFDLAVEASPTKHRVALLAVGGYGRGELAPYSDLDLLLVHDAKPKRVASDIEPIASAIWYPLWDAKVKLGHAVRRVDEQVDLLTGDLDSATALLTARHLAGDTDLAAEVMERGRQSWERQRATF